jgi:hypothetical protein
VLPDAPPYRIIAEPEAPPLPARRQSFTDPNFNTHIIRLTDETDGKVARISYGIWSAFSCDGRNILIQCDGLFKIVTWNPATADSWGDIPLPANFQGSDAIWSHTDPDLTYHRDGGSRLMKLNVSTGADLVVHDFADDFPDSPYLARMSASEDDQTFCFARQTKDYKFAGFCVYNVWQGRIVFREPLNRQGQYFKVQIDKSGRFVWNVALDPQSEWWDLSQPNMQTPVLTRGTGHSAMLSQRIAQYDNTANQDVLIDLTTQARKPLLAWPDWTLATEYSGVGSDDWYAVTAAAQWGGAVGPLHDELLQVAVDGSGRVRRICHLHNKLTPDYDSIPQPACGYGAFPWIAFHSSWGDSGRRDVFLAYTGGMSKPVITGEYPLDFVIIYAQEEPKDFTVTVGGKNVAAGGPYPMPNGQWQLNIPVPGELIGNGEVEVVLSCDGVASEPLKVKV